MTAAHANGRALVPLELPVRGHTEDLAGAGREDSAKERPNAARDLPPRDGPAPRQPAMTRPDGDTVIRILAAVVVLAVAAFAAAVSYNHIFELGRHHGQDGTAARLLPLSVDGLIASASLVMLHAARRELRVPVLARAMLALGVGATVAANVGYGLPFGWLAAVVSAWPAVAFVGSVEMAVRFVRDARQAGGPADVSEPSPDAEPEVSVPPPPPPPDPPKRRQPRQSERARAVAVLKRNPGLDDAEVMKRAGVSASTVLRARKEVNGDG